MCAVIEHRGPDSRGTFSTTGWPRHSSACASSTSRPATSRSSTRTSRSSSSSTARSTTTASCARSSRQRGHRFATRTDTEVIVHLYEDHGDDCVEHLRGMFAFALWDTRRQRLLLARDRVGKKPLFYAQRGGTLWFASEAKSILQDPEVAARRRPRRDRLLPALPVRARTRKSAFAALRKLPPAHTLSWEDGRIEIAPLLEALLLPDARLRRSSEEMHERIREELLEATRLRLRSDVPLGAFLSGGVDSSAVVAAMAQLSSGRVKTFSIGFDVEAFDETALRARGRGSCSAPTPRVPRRAARDGRPAEARLALRRAVRRPVGDPELLPRRAHPPARDRGAQRRRRRRGLRRLRALRRARRSPSASTGFPGRRFMPEPG